MRKLQVSFWKFRKLTNEQKKIYKLRNKTGITTEISVQFFRHILEQDGLFRNKSNLEVFRHCLIGLKIGCFFICTYF